MLQIHIEDVRLEERIETQARRVGQTPQELVREILTAAVPENGHPRLDPHRHGRVLDFEVLETENLDAVQPFAEVTDTAEFVRELRKQAWR